MSNESFSTTFTVEKSPQEVFAAINNVRAWWSGEIAGSTGRLGETFTYRVADVHFSEQKITELVPERKIVWHVTNAQLTFVRSKSEWMGI